MTCGRQRGASTLLILLIMVLLLVAFFAAYTLSRVGSGGDERNETLRRLSVGAAALERYAGANGRLPCPADGAANTGLEKVDDFDPTKCKFGDTGTLPWLTLGLNSDAGLDAWGRKISYRVYTGNAGSLTQAGGINMVECDLVDPAIPAAPKTATGLCVPNANPLLRSTTAATFLAGKGLKVDDYGTNRADVAYVLISHGATGGGAWTLAGAMLPLPDGDELKNTQADNFVARAFSDPDDADKPNRHFDDLLAFATIPQVVKRAGLEARDWPEPPPPPPPPTIAVSFDRPTLAAALGSNPGADTGQSSINLTYVTVSALDSSGNAQDVSFVGSGPNQGIGGINNGGDLSSGVGGPDETLRIDLVDHRRKFAFALDGFGYQSTFFGLPIWFERVEVRFYDVSGATATLRSTVTKVGCHADGGMATFSIDAGADFNRVELTPLEATWFSTTNASSFLLSEVAVCDATVTICQTAAQTAANECP